MDTLSILDGLNGHDVSDLVGAMIDDHDRVLEFARYLDRSLLHVQLIAGGTVFNMGIRARAVPCHERFLRKLRQIRYGQEDDRCSDRAPVTEVDGRRVVDH